MTSEARLTSPSKGAAHSRQCEHSDRSAAAEFEKAFAERDRRPHERDPELLAVARHQLTIESMVVRI